MAREVPHSMGYAKDMQMIYTLPLILRSGDIAAKLRVADKWSQSWYQRAHCVVFVLAAFIYLNRKIASMPMSRLKEIDAFLIISGHFLAEYAQCDFLFPFTLKLISQTFVTLCRDMWPLLLAASTESCGRGICSQLLGHPFCLARLVPLADKLMPWQLCSGNNINRINMPHDARTTVQKGQDWP